MCPVSPHIVRCFTLLCERPGSMTPRYAEFVPGGKMKRLLLPLILMYLPCAAWSALKPQASSPAATVADSTASSTGNDLGAASTEMLSVIQGLLGRWAVEVTFDPRSAV